MEQFRSPSEAVSGAQPPAVDPVADPAANPPPAAPRPDGPAAPSPPAAAVPTRAEAAAAPAPALAALGSGLNRAWVDGGRRLLRRARDAEALRRLAAEPLDARLRDAVAWAVLVVIASLATITVIAGGVDRGVTLSAGTDPDGRPVLVVAAVAPWSEAAQRGLKPGMIVIGFNDQLLVPVPGVTDQGDPRSAQVPYSISSDQIWSVEATWSWSLAPLLAGQGGPTVRTSVFETTDRFASSPSAFVAGLVLLVGASWWLASGRAGDRLRRLAWPTASAVAGPLLLFPVQATASGVGYLLTAILLPAAILPLADGLSTFVDGPEPRRAARVASAAAATAGLVGGLLVLVGLDRSAFVAQWLGVGLAAAIPGIAAARSTTGGRLADGSPTSGRVVEAIEAPALGLTPAVAALPLAAPGGGVLFGPLLVWLAGLLAAQRFTVRPLARLASRTALQRDLIVAATEAERARIAADIHDDVLQELTLLVRRLDAAGAADAATTARRVAERLRAITGELRLPILDDLGVGPALEWLVARVERLAGGEVRLERDDGTRLPPEVELAFFRVAQEALANAVKHGRPPIVVRYRTSPSGATLSVDDSGPGIDPGAAEAARVGGHFGLLAMEQRAEQIGAILDVRRWPAGGTHVALEWRPR